MTLTIQTLEQSFVVEVIGLQLWEDLDQAVVDEIDALWSTMGVLVFRRQALSEAELIAFSRRFGTLEKIVRQDWASEHYPEVIRISNMRNAAGEPIGGLGSGELAWHTDQSYMAHPATGSVLYMVEKPRNGGHTYWANLHLAYAALPRQMQVRLEGKRGIFSYAKRQAGYNEDTPLPAEVRRQTPDVVHPLVNVHPRTGHKTLYLDPSTTCGIEGMSDAAGCQLLAELNQHATQASFVYKHEWQIGDVVMWDNGFLLHRRDPYEASQNRLLKRTTIQLSPLRHIIPGSSGRAT